MWLVSAAEMRECDRRTIEERGVPGLVLMERAGLGIYREIRRRFDELCRRRIWIVCGRGNNGGDGLVLARHLHDGGYNPRVLLTGPADAITGDAALERAPLAARGVPLEPLTPALLHAIEDAPPCDLIVDAILGTGFKGILAGALADAVTAMTRSRATVIAVDIPSGLSADHGAVEGPAVRADLTVTMGAPKRSFPFWPARGHVGEWTVVDLGIPEEVYSQVAPAARLLRDRYVAESLPPFPRDAHKGTRGKVLIAGGSPGLTGAPCLAALGAARAGAGLVRVAVPRSLNPILEEKLTEPMTFPVDETESGTLSPNVLDFLLRLAGEWDSLALGPGLGRHPETDRLAAAIYARWPRPLVLDADGLSAIAEAGIPERAADRPVRVLTPHPGEMARLTGRTIDEILADPIEVARSFAARHDLVLVLKGPATVVAAPTGPAFVNTTGNPGLATGGSGDVLSGVIATFLAQKLEPFRAAACAVYLHGLAADLVARKRTERACSPSVVAEGLAAAWSALGAERGRNGA